MYSTYCMYVFMYVCMYVYMYVCMYVCVVGDRSHWRYCEDYLHERFR